MKPEIEISQVRELLEQWYAAEIEAEDEALLWRYFAEADEVPADLWAEAVMFGRQGDGSGMVSEAPAPDDELLSRIDAAVEAEGRRRPSRARVLYRVVGLSAVAAAIAALLLVSGSDPEPSPTGTNRSPQLFARVDTVNETNGEQNLAKTEKKPAPKDITVAHAESSPKVDADGYIIITSPQEASQIFQTSMANLNRGIELSTASLVIAGETMSKTATVTESTVIGAFETLSTTTNTIKEPI